MSQREKSTKSGTAHHESALGYLKRGWAVVPAGEGEKRPIVRWQRFQHEMPTEKQVTGWFARWPRANLAVVTGEISGVVVVDIDPKHGGMESLEALEARHGPLPNTVESISGGGGRHLYFAYPGREVRNRVGLAPGIDMRGDGGCIVVPPSIHPSGKRYRWKSGHSPGDVDLAPLPVWLEQPRFGGGDPEGHPSAYWRALAQEGVREGQRNTTVASFAGHLLWHGVDPDVAMELLLSWNRVRCKPPLDDDEVIQTVRSIVRTHRRSRQSGLKS